jgi:hypothetical protein
MAKLIKNQNFMEQTTKTPTIQEVAVSFDELSQQEKWFQIEDEFFSDDVKSIDPPNSPYFGYEDFIKKVQSFHGAYTTQPVIGGNHFSVRG